MYILKNKYYLCETLKLILFVVMIEKLLGCNSKFQSNLHNSAKENVLISIVYIIVYKAVSLLTV